MNEKHSSFVSYREYAVSSASILFYYFIESEEK